MGEHTARNMRLRHPVTGAQCRAYHEIGHWLWAFKKQPPEENLDLWEQLLRCNPPIGIHPLSVTQWEKAMAQIQEWRDERESLEVETLRWLNMPEDKDSL